MLLQRNINAFSIPLTDRGLRMDGDGVGNRTKPSSVSVNDFYQELRNYRILLFLSRITELQNSFFYQELRNYRILLFLSRITELQNSFFLSRITELQNSIIFIKNYGITEFYCLSADPL